MIYINKIIWVAKVEYITNDIKIQYIFDLPDYNKAKHTLFLIITYVQGNYIIQHMRIEDSQFYYNYGMNLFNLFREYGEIHNQNGEFLL